MMRRRLFLLACLAAQAPHKRADALTLVMMGARRGRRGGGAGGGAADSLKRALDAELGGNGGSSKKPLSPRSVNRGRGQEILGVTLPAEGSLKGWEFGDNVRMVATKVGGTYYAVQGDCPRCGFDLWKGTLLVDDDNNNSNSGFDDLPRVACPTCSTTYSLRSGKVGPPLKRGGLAGFVGNLAKTATATEAGKSAKAYVITRDDNDGRAYCRER